MKLTLLRRLIFVTLLSLLSSKSVGQDLLDSKLKEFEKIKEREKELIAEIETLKLQKSINALQQVGFPVTDKPLEIIQHTGMVLGFDCDYKLAAWTFHQLTPDVIAGTESRSNNFRKDPKISCSTAVEADYFTRSKQTDGTYKYNGFGYNRGHLAPSADFKWSATALSESYFYSNMTPQHPDFNRKSWAELEGLLRKIVDREQKTYYIITGPVLNENLPVISASVNQLRIPQLHYKIIVDLSVDKPRGMAFVMPNKACEQALSHYVVSIDSVERLTGLNFFPNINAQLEVLIESKSDFNAWATQHQTTDVEPLNALELPKGHFNTKQAETKAGSNVSIVGKVVSTKFVSKSESTFLNLDKSFPNQIFTVNIWKDGRANFSYQPEVELEGKYIAVTGVVSLDKSGVPCITVTSEEQIRFWE